MDNTLRTHERAAATGDLDAEVWHLVARERAGVPGLTVPCGDVHIWHKRWVLSHNPNDCPKCHGTGRVPFMWPQRLALAAYCGSEAARVLRPDWGHHYCDGYTAIPETVQLTTFLGRGGLLRWPNALLRGAVAAARVILRGFEETARVNRKGLLTHLALQPRRVIEAVDAHLDEQNSERLHAWQTAWDATNGEHEWLPCPLRDNAHAIQVAAQIATEDAVRDAIRAELVWWALS